jgi:archaellum biogenesis ATPase FlaH
LDLFIDLLSKGYKGFAITRTNPRYLMDKGSLDDAKMVWLTDKESSSFTTIPPSLERIIYEIGDFLKNEKKGCLVLDGIEYLVSSNSFDPVLRFMRRIIDDVSESQSVLLVTIGPYTLKPQEMKILEREMEKISYNDKKS